ncbi:DUF3267 domain-containing protein [bacterium]|nr:DUF3267 domain-containing protein [bacterium]
MKTKYYFSELPENYEEVFSIDATKRKTSILFTVFAGVITAVLIFLVLLYIKKPSEIETNDIIVPAFLIAPSMIIYIILHELTHGLFYKIFTHEKLKFGFTLTVAYCGVPNLYVKKWPNFITVIAPFVIFNIVFLIPFFLIDSYFYKLLFGILLSIHNSGCIGDLTVAYLLLFRFRDKDYLINDTGPKQTFYKKVRLE